MQLAGSERLGCRPKVSQSHVSTPRRSSSARSDASALGCTRWPHHCQPLPCHHALLGCMKARAQRPRRLSGDRGVRETPTKPRGAAAEALRHHCVLTTAHPPCDSGPPQVPQPCVVPNGTSFFLTQAATKSGRAARRASVRWSERGSSSRPPLCPRSRRLRRGRLPVSERRSRGGRSRCRPPPPWARRRSRRWCRSRWQRPARRLPRREVRRQQRSMLKRPLTKRCGALARHACLLRR